MVEYKPGEYWRGLHRRTDLSAVGQSGLPGDLNTWIYKSIRRNLRTFARRHKLSPNGPARMLEVGVGSGFWVDFWQRLGWQVDGCDLVPDAVERLREVHPSARFWVADVSSTDGILGASDGLAADGYDLVTATSVLLHVTEDAAFEQALVNVAGAVRPGGHLLLVEPALTIKKKQAPFDPAKHSRARVLRSYEEPLQRLGMELVDVAPTTVLAANPLEAGGPRRRRAYRKWWARVSQAKEHPRRVRWLGPTMYALDWVLMRTGEAPTSKILLFRRPA